MNKARNVRNEFLLCLFLGWLGAHRFHRKQPLIGILYLFSVGIAGIGWFVDTVILLIKLIKTSSNQHITEPIKNNEAAAFHSAIKQVPTPEQRENKRLAGEKNEREHDRNIVLLESKKPVATLSLTKLKKYDHIDLIEVGDQLEVEENCNDNDDSFYLFTSGIFELGETGEKAMVKIKDAGIDDVVEDAFYIVSEVDKYEYKCKVSVFPKSKYNEDGCRLVYKDIVGTKYDNDDGTSRTAIISQMSEGDKIHLSAIEYEGKPAVSVSNRSGQIIGYMKKEFAEEIYRRIMAKEIGTVYLSEITQNDDESFNCTMAINIEN